MLWKYRDRNFVYAKWSMSSVRRSDCFSLYFLIAAHTDCPSCAAHLNSFDWAIWVIINIALEWLKPALCDHNMKNDGYKSVLVDFTDTDSIAFEKYFSLFFSQMKLLLYITKV